MPVKAAVGRSIGALGSLVGGELPEGDRCDDAVPSLAPAVNWRGQQKTLPERLKTAGYRTGMVGKWHLGTSERHQPLDRGFEEFFGFIGGSNPYLPQGPKRVVPRILRGREDANEKEYLTDAFAREAVAYVDRQAREPFFLYLAFNAPHGPLQASDKYLERFAGIADEKRRTYAAMVSAMDDAVGAVLDKLRTSGVEQNTLIFFISDNGGPTDVNGSLNTPFRGVKGEVREGGIRSPFFVQWKAKLPSEKEYAQPVIQLDILPTILAAARIAPGDTRLDGVDLIPYLAGEQAGSPHETLFWRFRFPANQPTRHKWAIRQGDWKLFTDIDANRKQGDRADAAERVKLVNLADDAREEHNLSAKHPNKVAALIAAWNVWNEQMAEPGGEEKK